MPKFFTFCAIVLFTLIAMVAVASHSKAQMCVTVNIVKSNLVQRYPKARVATIGGADMINFMLGFNSILPVTRLEADEGVTLEDQNKPKVAIVLFSDGCFTTIIFLNRGEFHHLMGEI